MTDITADGRAAPPSAETVPVRHVIAFIAMVFGMFMAILDIQIVSASLGEIQAGLSAGRDEIAWVQTSYLIAEVIMIPLSGMLARILSTRVLFTVSAAGFTLASALCSTATNIDQMIVYRAIQGFVGGGMIPAVYATAFSVFPRSMSPIVTPIIGLTATLAPTIGPTVGGYISSSMSWHWLFLINIVPGVIVTIAAWMLIDFDRPDRAPARRFDWSGFVGMAAFLGGLEYVLEEGPGHGWFDNTTIAFVALVMVLGGSVFFYRAFTARHPVVDLRAFSDVNFSFGSLFSFVLGTGLYGLTYLYPLYLGSVRGYDAMMIGQTMFISGLAMFLSTPLVGILSARMDPRLMIMAGFVGFGAGTLMLSAITTDWDYGELLVPQILRGVSLMLCMVPITNLALGTLPPERTKNASGLFNLTRNLGGAVGLALINTLLTERDDFHYARLAESVTWANGAAIETLDGLTRTFAANGLEAADAAIARMTAMTQQQAWVLSLADVFYVLTIIFFGLALGALIMRKPENTASAETH